MGVGWEQIEGCSEPRGGGSRGGPQGEARGKRHHGGGHGVGDRWLEQAEGCAERDGEGVGRWERQHLGQVVERA